MLFFLIRHGDPIYNPDSLTPLGERQAEAVAKRLALYGIDRIYASSSKRAQLTAAPTAELVKKDVTILDWCNEGHAWRDLTVPLENGRKTWCFQHPETARFLNSDEVRALGRKWYTHPRFEGTAFAEGIERIQRESDALFASLGYEHCLDSNGYIAKNHTKERVALFAHQGFGLAFLSCLLDVPYPIFSTHFDMGHSGMTVIEFVPSSPDGYTLPTVLQLANDSHVYREGLPTNYQNRLYF